MERPPPEETEVPAPRTPRPKPSDTESLEAIFQALSQARGERTELVDDVRTRMDGGEYMSAEKLNLAIHRLLKESLA